MAIIGIDLGGTKLASARFGEDGHMDGRRIDSVGQRKDTDVGLLVKQVIGEHLNAATRNGSSVKAVGISVPGIYHAARGTVWAPNIPGWDDYPLLEELSTDEAFSGLDIRIDSDRACYILGETWKGCARGCRHVVFLAVGTGIGAGILIDGNVLRGRHDIAGAVGWMAMDRPFRQEYKSCGCFEYHAAGEGLTRIARDFLRSEPGYGGILEEKSEDQLTTLDIFHAYETGDPLAEKVIENAISLWGMAAANMVSIFNPEMIVFGGGVFGPAARFLEDIRSEAKKWAQPVSITQVDIRISELGGDAGLYGAGYLGLGPQF